MKKNIAMRVAAFLFILTMISTCAFATTFAKYTTSKSAEDSARVAKWGVTVQATDAEKLFANAYDGTVLAADSADVVAPGTDESFGGFTITGSPEVSVNVTYSAELTLEGWVVNGENYCPIVITVNNKEYSDATMAGLKSKVEAAIAAQSKEYAAGTPIANTLTVSWSWAIGADNDDETNKKDTALGNIAADKDPSNDPTISLSITCTVTQKD